MPTKLKHEEITSKSTSTREHTPIKADKNRAAIAANDLTIKKLPNKGILLDNESNAFYVLGYN